MELVTDLISPTQRGEKLCQELQRIFRTLAISDADMEKGHMQRNISIRTHESDMFGTKLKSKISTHFVHLKRRLSLN